jgi:hypothetical protein
MLDAEALLAGAEQTYTVTIPSSILSPGSKGEACKDEDSPSQVTLRPLCLIDIQRLRKAAGESSHLASVLMVQQSLVAPRLSIDQVNRMHAGLVQFLLQEVNRISGLDMERDELENMVQAPLARACFVLSREFGWTPEQCAGLTVGQVLLYLEMLGKNKNVTAM